MQTKYFRETEKVWSAGNELSLLVRIRPDILADALETVRDASSL